jgi:hypothetical protein
LDTAKRLQVLPAFGERAIAETSKEEHLGITGAAHQEQVVLITKGQVLEPVIVDSEAAAFGGVSEKMLFYAQGTVSFGAIHV